MFNGKIYYEKVFFKNDGPGFTYGNHCKLF